MVEQLLGVQEVIFGELVSNRILTISALVASAAEG
jgi:hypothetical protein